MLLACMLILRLPASTAGYVLSTFSQGRFILENPQGSLWQGEGTLRVRHPHQQQLLLGQLGWQLLPWRGDATPLLRLDQAPLSAELTLTGLNLTIKNLELPANSLLALMLPMLPADSYGGRLTCPLVQAGLNRDGTGNLDTACHWHEASIRQPELIRLGTIQANMQARFDTRQLSALSIHLESSRSAKNDLFIELGLSLPGKASGRIEVPTTRQARLAPYLRAFTQPLPGSPEGAAVHGYIIDESVLLQGISLN